jgi:1-deoxy-D-xylulose-5-phosphate synthase
VDVPVKTFGLPQEFLAHGTRDEVLEEAGLTSQQLALRITEAVARLSSAEALDTHEEDARQAREAAPEGRPVE